MRKIRRTFIWSKCFGQRYNFQTKEFEDYSCTLLGNYTPKRATNKLQKLEKDSTILINRIEVESKMYAVDPEIFIQYGERIK